MRRLLVLSILSLLVMMSVAPAMALDFDAKTFYGMGTLVLPMGDFSDHAGTGFGGCIGVTVPHTDEIIMRGEIGYIMFGDQDLPHFDFSYSFMPFMVLAEYHRDLSSPMYFLGGAGLTRVAFDADYTGPEDPTGLLGDTDDSSMELTLCGGAGYQVNEQFSVEGRFNMVSDANNISIVGVYNF
ncbi:MAG: outer membrane beta-barrel protein [bacterium]|nr:outer membrane beta-barrel protein [bacterium]